MAVSVPFYATWDDDALRRAQRDVDGFGQGILGSIGKLAGPLAAVGGAIAGAFAGAQIFGFAKDAIDSASGIGESLSKLNVLIPESAAQFDAWSSTTAKSFGIAKTDALEAAGGFVGLFKAAGKTGEAGIEASKRFVELAADMASFNNASPEETLQALQSGLRGEAEPLRKFNVLLDDATLRQVAFKKGIIASDREALTPAQKTLAAYEAILEKTTDQQGDFARTADGAANKQRILAAQLDDTKTRIGDALLPVYNTLLEVVADKLVPAFEKFADWLNDNKDEIKLFFDRALIVVEQAWAEYGPLVEQFGKAFGDTVKPLLDAFVTGDWSGFFDRLAEELAGADGTLTDIAGELGYNVGRALVVGLAKAIIDVEAGGFRWDDPSTWFDFQTPAWWTGSPGGFVTKIGEWERRRRERQDMGSGSSGGGAPPEMIGVMSAPTNVNVTFTGLVTDPVAVANQINDLLSQQNARLGVV